MDQSVGLAKTEKSLPLESASSRSSNEEESKGIRVLEKRKFIRLLRKPKSSNFLSHCINLGSFCSVGPTLTSTIPSIAFGAEVSFSSFMES